MENGTQMTFEQWMPEACPEQTAGVLDSLARTFQLQESNLDSTDIVQVCFSQLQNLLESSKKKIDPSTFLLRTLKTYLVLMQDLTLPDFSLRWMKLGMMQNGKFSIPKTSEFHRTGNDVLLLDILEENVPHKYFLSREQMEKIIFQ